MRLRIGLLVEVVRVVLADLLKSETIVKREGKDCEGGRSIEGKGREVAYVHSIPGAYVSVDCTSSSVDYDTISCWLSRFTAATSLEMEQSDPLSSTRTLV